MNLTIVKHKNHYLKTGNVLWVSKMKCKLVSFWNNSLQDVSNYLKIRKAFPVKSVKKGWFWFDCLNFLNHSYLGLPTFKANLVNTMGNSLYLTAAQKLESAAPGKSTTAYIPWSIYFLNWFFHLSFLFVFQKYFARRCGSPDLEINQIPRGKSLYTQVQVIQARKWY